MNIFDRVYDWSTDPATPAWKGLGIVIGIPTLVVAGIVITLILVLGGNTTCPAGQTFGVTGYTGMITVNGAIVPPQPVYGCVPGQ